LTDYGQVFGVANLLPSVYPFACWS